MNQIIPLYRFFVMAAFLLTILALHSCSLQCLVQVPPQCSYNNPYATELRTRDHFMDSATARIWINRYIVNKDSICHDAINTHNNILPDSSESFNRDIIKELLCIKDCIGIRIYNGMDDDYQVHFILAGIDPCGNTLYIHRASTANTRLTYNTESGVGEMGLKP